MEATPRTKWKVRINGQLNDLWVQWSTVKSLILVRSYCNPFLEETPSQQEIKYNKSKEKEIGSIFHSLYLH